MEHTEQFYIDGKWVDPRRAARPWTSINPATEEVARQDRASATPPTSTRPSRPHAKAFATWSQTSREERLELLSRILADYQKRFGDLADAITDEMGAPASLAQRAQAPIGMRPPVDRHRGALEDFKFEETAARR